MVKVVGDAPEHIKQTTCRHCAARLEYTQSEVTRRTGRDYDGGGYVQELLKCPRCGSEVVVREW